MKLVHFAYILTALLLVATSYLAWEGQQAARGAKAELDFVKKKQAAQDNAKPSGDSLVSLPTVPTPATSITPPSPGNLADTPALTGTGGNAGLELPGGGLTVPKSVAAAEARGINTNTLTPTQKQILGSKPLAKVKTVVKEQGFVILDSGTKQGINKGQKLFIRRANGILAHIQVSDTVEENEAVADLDLASIPQGVSIEPGDEVIQPLEN